MRNTGADINQEGEGSTTPLHMAAQAGHTSLVERMVSWGADVDIKDISGATPLRLAQSFGHKPGWMLNSQGRWNLLQEFAAGLYYRTLLHISTQRTLCMPNSQCRRNFCVFMKVLTTIICICSGADCILHVFVKTLTAYHWYF